jgi:hypothetical protein
VLDLRLDQKIDGASGCLHSCMHCGEAQGDTMEACVHRMLYCSAVQSSVDEFRSQDFGLKLNWEAPMGSDLVYSILSQNGTLIRPATRFVIGLQSHACSAESICAGLWRLDLWRRLDLVMRFQSQHTNVGCLAGFV